MTQRTSMMTELVRLAKFLAVALALIAIPQASFAAGDAAKGKTLYKKCSICHALEEGKNKVGPSLYNIVDRQAGTVAGFKYSDSYVAAGKKGLKWSKDNLIAYLEYPKKFMKKFLGSDSAKSRMVNKFKKLQDREDIAAYLISLKKK